LIVALAFLAGAAIATAFVMIVVDVGIRSSGIISPPALSSAVVEISLLYFTLLAAPYLVREKCHVYIDAVISRLRGQARWVIEKAVYCICIATSLVFSFIGSQLAINALSLGTFEERSVDVPSWILYLPLGPVFLLVAIEFGRYLIGVDTMYRDNTQAVESL
jgi:TRAP-type C4-dicarboxylate transport system permease small subunit